ncbi:radical SAM/SPASM domain-containing protein [Nonomuraea angiospora]|uniref:Radical SAM core domain-containing protein n=1 Tax=Nonomuraea angiospora TaxID=46172 RepID=A0ABR9LPU0_9ACTN|nr:radical SAM protein [Nonomuraea angiospora]MBE1582298.1 uncharacterized protein [Nonomuraea angiospora]
MRKQNVKQLSLPGPGNALSVILKLPGETCNINCFYCYEKRKPYPEAVQLQPEMLRRFLGLCGQRPLRIELHGGEPLMLRRELMAELLAELRAYPGTVSLAIQTNGILLNDAWIEFFKREWPDIEIGVSLDGPTEINDAYRVDYRDRGTAGRVEATLRRLNAHGLRIGVIAVVARRSLGHARELISYFGGFPAIRFLKLVPCLDYNVTTEMLAPADRKENLLTLNPSGRGAPDWATSPKEYADFINEAFDVWREDGFRHFVLEPVYSAMRGLLGDAPSFCHFSDTKCAWVLTLYPDGRLGSCDELRMPEAEHAKIGELEDIDEVLRMQRNPALGHRLNALYGKCSTCDYQDTCRGGCLATRLQFLGTAYDDEYCMQRIQIIEHVASALRLDPVGGGTPGTRTPDAVTRKSQWED